MDPVGPVDGDRDDPRSVGPHRLGEYAREQLDAARRDPRLDRDDRAFLADYLDYLDEADRVRVLALGAIEELAGAPVAQADDADADAQAAWERSELAKAACAAGHPFLNATTLVGMFGNLDALVERLAPSFRRQGVDVAVSQLLRRAEAIDPEAPAVLDDDVRAAVRDVVAAEVSERWPAVARLWGAAPERWERVLASVGLPPRTGHPLPVDLVSALEDLSALRDVVVHRAGRVDARALTKSPGLAVRLGYAEGQFVRIGRADYRRYSAALRVYGAEIAERVFACAGISTGHDLRSWQDQHYLGA